jgi:ABC-type amino acid transport substrate-binding protein
VTRATLGAAAATLSVLCAAPVAAAADARGEAAPVPGELVVALGLADPVLQAGVVRGRDVILARGFEVELARALGRRLGHRTVRFVHVPTTTRLLASSAVAGWQLALAGLDSSAATHATAELSAPYLTTDVAVVARRGLPRPRGLDDLRRAQLCAVRGSETAAAARAVRPRRSILLVPGVERLRQLLRAGACDAALVAAAAAGRLAGPEGQAAVGRVERGSGIRVLVARGGGLQVRDVDRALAGLRRDGTLGRLARVWLGLDPARLRVLR